MTHEEEIKLIEKKGRAVEKMSAAMVRATEKARIMIDVTIQASEIIEGLSKPVSEWISVDDRLPEIGENILLAESIFSEFDKFMVARLVKIDLNTRGRYTIKWSVDGECRPIEYKSSHWMPLPKPPKT